MLILLILLLQTVPYLLCSLKINPPPNVGATTPRNNQQPQDSHRMNNVPGNFYVDQSTCYDCDVCRWMCPQVFDRKGLSAVVYQQPSNDDEKLKALSAMLACPVNAIRTETPEPLVKVAMQIFPTFINQKSIPNVLHLGYHAANSYGATPYLLKRKRGNVMIDCPRYNSR
jgi:ferredoxin